MRVIKVKRDSMTSSTRQASTMLNTKKKKKNLHLIFFSKIISLIFENFKAQERNL